MWSLRKMEWTCAFLAMGCAACRSTPPASSPSHTDRASVGRPSAAAETASSATLHFPAADDLEGRLHWALDDAKDELRWIEFLGVLHSASGGNPAWEAIAEDISTTRAAISAGIDALSRASRKARGEHDRRSALAKWLDEAPRLRRDRADLVRIIADRVLGNRQPVGLGVLRSPIDNRTLHIPTPHDREMQFAWALSDSADEVRWGEFVMILMAAPDADHVKWQEMSFERFNRASAAAIAAYSGLGQPPGSSLASIAQNRERQLNAWLGKMEWVKNVRRSFIREVAERVYGVHDERTLDILGGDE